MECHLLQLKDILWLAMQNLVMRIWTHHGLRGGMVRRGVDQIAAHRHHHLVRLLKFSSDCRRNQSRQKRSKTNSIRVSRTVLSPIFKWASNSSAGPPYASIFRATVHLWRAENPNCPAAFLLCLKKLFLAVTSSTIRRNNSLLMRNLQHKIRIVY